MSNVQCEMSIFREIIVEVEPYMLYTLLIVADVRDVLLGREVDES